MKTARWTLLSGVLAWLVPFVVSYALASVRRDDRIFFETLMPLVLVATAAVLLVASARTPLTLRRGLELGLTWLAISLFFDLLMFMWGPLAMSFADYMKEIGCEYLIYPIMTVGAALVVRRGRKM